MAEMLNVNNKSIRDIVAGWVKKPIVGETTTLFDKTKGVVVKTTVVEKVNIIHYGKKPYVCFETKNTIYSISGVIL